MTPIWHSDTKLTRIYDPTENLYDYPNYVITQQPPRRRHFRLLTPFGWLILSVAVVYVTIVWATFDFLGDVSVPGEITVEWVRE